MGPARFWRASSVHRGLPAKKRHEALSNFNTEVRTDGAHMARDPARDAEQRLDFPTAAYHAAWPYE